MKIDRSKTEFFTPKECADRFGVSRETLITLIKKGKLKAIKVGKNFKISDSNLREFMEQGEYKINSN